MTLLKGHPLLPALLLLTEGHLVAFLNPLVASYVLYFLKPYRLFYPVRDCGVVTHGTHLSPLALKWHSQRTYVSASPEHHLSASPEHTISDKLQHACQDETSL